MTATADKPITPPLPPSSRGGRGGDRSRRKTWTFRLLAVLLGLSVFGMAEGVCRIAGWGRPTDYPDPYVGFSRIHPLFVKDDERTRYVIPKSRRGFFRPESFPVEKGEKTFRIFCFGGSTVQGRPYSTETSFTTWLELSLNAGDKRRDWQVVNCGGISYASYRLAPIVKECRKYKPDLFIICTGHNEFLEERTYEHIKHAPKAVAVPMHALSRLRTVTLAREAVNQLTGRTVTVSEDRPKLKSEVDALLDYRNGLKAYHRDEEWRKDVVEHFEFNLRRMIAMARARDIPVILILPPSNLRHMLPFKSEHKDGLTAAEQERWEDLLKHAKLYYHSDLEEAAALLEQAVAVDNQHAATVYELGRCYDALWQRTRDDRWLQKAKAAYLQARELDICPLRMIAPLQEAMRRVADETGTPLIDAHALLEADCPGKILDNTFLVDHIHPSPIKGHRRIARAIADQMQKQGWFEPTSDWESLRKKAFRRHLRSLDDIYFERGRNTLNVLMKAWAKGLADGPPIESRSKAPDGKRANEH